MEDYYNYSPLSIFCHDCSLGKSLYITYTYMLLLYFKNILKCV